MAYAQKFSSQVEGRGWGVVGGGGLVCLCGVCV